MYLYCSFGKAMLRIRRTFKPQYMHSSAATRGARRSHPLDISRSKLGIARGRNFSYAAGRESKFFNTVNNGRQCTFEYDDCSGLINRVSLLSTWLCVEWVVLTAHKI